MNSAAIGYSASFAGLPLPGSRSDWRVGVAVVASVLIHGLALGWLPGLEGRKVEQEPRQPVQVHFAAPMPEPAAHSPPAPTFVEPSVQALRRAPVPVLKRTLPELASPAPEAGTDAPVVRSVEPPVALPLESPRPAPVVVASRPAVVDAEMLAAFGRVLAGAVATHQRYPRIALLRQWQGTALLQLELAADGRLLGVRVLSSSGHDALDRQALDMVREAVPLPSMPPALAGRALTVDVPVVFRITS